MAKQQPLKMNQLQQASKPSGGGSVKVSPQTKYTGKQGKTDYILKNVNLVHEQPKYAKGAITHKAKNNI